MVVAKQFISMVARLGALWSSALKKGGTKEAEHVAANKAAKEAADIATKKAEAEAKQLAEAKAKEAAAKRAAAIAAASAAAVVVVKDTGKIAESNGGSAFASAEKSLLKGTEDAAKVVGKQGKTEAKNASESFMRKNPKLVIGGVAAAGFAAAGMAKYEANNNKKVTITTISASPDGKGSVITFSPGFDILKTDKVDISGTNSNPSIDGSLVAIVKVLSKTQIQIATTVSTAGTTGTMINHTSFEGQVTNQMAVAGGAVIGAGLDVAGGAIDKGLTAAGFPTPAVMWAKYKWYLMALLAVVLALKFWPSGKGASAGSSPVQYAPRQPLTASLPRTSAFPTETMRRFR